MVDVELEYELLPDDEKFAVMESAKGLLDKIDPKNKTDEINLYRSNVWPGLNRFTSFSNIKPVLLLAPLDRIGSSKGQSGSNVLVGYFYGIGKQFVTPSYPMIIKVGKIEGRDKVKEEHENFKKVDPYIIHGQNNFAKPLHCDTHQFNTGVSLSVLWSPCTQHDHFLKTVKSKKLNFSEVKEFLRLIRESSDLDKLKHILDIVFESLSDLHNTQGKNRNVKLFNEYKDYLRGVNSNTSWGHYWKKIWGTTSEPFFEMGEKWISPFYVLNKLKELPKTPLFSGIVHGDLHPRNLILGFDDQPVIIDFGWTRKNKHIAMDFVLFEANLRFVYLPSEVDFSSLNRMANWLQIDRLQYDTGDKRCNTYCDLILYVREKARKIIKNPNIDLNISSEIYWIINYEIPLFLVSFGLLKYISSFDNQVATRLSILASAKRINEVLPQVEIWLENNKTPG